MGEHVKLAFARIRSLTSENNQKSRRNKRKRVYIRMNRAFPEVLEYEGI